MTSLLKWIHDRSGSFEIGNKTKQNKQTNKNILRQSSEQIMILTQAKNIRIYKEFFSLMAQPLLIIVYSITIYTSCIISAIKNIIPRMTMTALAREEHIQRSGVQPSERLASLAIIWANVGPS